ncbi:MAG: MtnX-like HAD-IB family phosphatase, partial [Vallitaleaceae bacterium]|nr:MtnX-like HAD-IB family phosphatase [Vallitaleaceae bacterium]
EWKKTHKIDVEFLNKVFSWHPFSDEELIEVLGKVKIDPFTKELVQFITEQDGGFLILSAGFNYYIERALKRDGLEELTLISNPGVFENQIFVMKPDVNKSYYSPIYGVDKERVVLEHKEKYKKVYFAGDSEPDLKAALAADLVFAKGELIPLLESHHKPFHKFTNYKEVIAILKEALSNEQFMD